MIGCTIDPVSGAASQRNRNLIGPGAQVFVDGTHVRHLQPPAKLDAEETEAHVPNLPERAWWFVHKFFLPTILLPIVQRDQASKSRAQLAAQCTRTIAPFPVSADRAGEIHACHAA